MLTSCKVVILTIKRFINLTLVEELELTPDIDATENVIYLYERCPGEYKTIFKQGKPS